MICKVINTYLKTIFKLPSKYKFLDRLGEGGFGRVVKCLDKETRQIVAIKLPKFLDRSSTDEAALLKRFRDLNLDKHNIVKCFGSWRTRLGYALILEVYDVSLHDYCKKRILKPMRLSDIRTITQQLATALHALKRIGVIHTDIKLYNIMIEDHHRRPFKVKLIDFGSAIPISKARQGAYLQPLCVRSPEIILGSPFSEAIDMWSLGCVLARMICGYHLFSGTSEYEQLREIIEVLHLPANHVFNDGLRANIYCKKTRLNTWRLKSRKEYGRFNFLKLNACHDLKSLDDLKNMREEEENKDEAVEREHCIELLKAMLTVDADKRITPREVLNHPFITKDQTNSQTNLSETSSDEALSSTSDESANYTSYPKIGPSGLIMVQPCPPENTRLLDDQESAVSVQSGLNKTSESSVSDTKTNTTSAICEGPTTCTFCI